MRRLLSLALIAFLTISISTCSDSGTGPDSGNDNDNNGGGDETATYTVSVESSSSDAGTVSPSGENTYNEGEEIELQANPNDEYKFSGWSGDIESTDNPHSLNVDQDYDITANFELKSYELTVNKEGEGTVNEEVLEQKSKEYEHGTVVELTATPAEGYRFVEWQGEIEGMENPTQITVDDPKEVTAVFEKKSYALTVNTDGAGAVSEEIVQQKSTDYEHGTVVELTANPAEGWKFVEWKMDVNSSSVKSATNERSKLSVTKGITTNSVSSSKSSENPIQITVDSPKKVTAVFKRKSFEINTQIEGEGSISKTPDQESYEYNSSAYLEATPAEGYEFVEWTGDISSAENPYNLAVNSDKNITAVFKKNSYDLTINTQGEGSVSEEVIQAKSYDHGTQVRLTANPAEGWQFVEWQGDVTGSDNPTQITVDQAKEVTAVFEKKSYALTVNTDGEGAVSEEVVQAKSTSYDHGTTVQLTANAAEGWRFIEWQGAVTGNDNPVQVTVDNPKEVTAVFVKIYDVTVNVEGNGDVEQEVIKDADYGVVIELTANPEKDWKFLEWKGDLTGSTNPTHVINDSPKDVTAVFVNKTPPLTINISGEGSVKKNPDLAEYNYGSTVELTAEPATGWKFVKWEGAKTSAESQIQLIVDEAKTINAVFEKKVFSLSIERYGTGSVSFTPFELEHKYGTTVELTASTNSDWKFKEWQGDVRGTSNPISITMDEDKSITAVFENSTFAGGIGTLEDPFKISTIDQLQAVNDYITSHFVLINDIDASETSSWNNGKGFNPIGSFFEFQGTFDGKGHEITNLYINRPGSDNVGLFSSFTNEFEMIENVLVKNATITGRNNVGGIVGLADYRTNIFNSGFVGSVTGEEKVGGLVGMNIRADVYNSFSKGSVNGTKTTGGLVGLIIEGGSVKTAYSQAAVSGNDEVGGLVGRVSTMNGMGGDIRTSYASGTVDGSGYVGGFSGRNYGQITDSYWDTEGTNQSNGTGDGYTGPVGLATPEITGTSAETNLSGFRWSNSPSYDSWWVISDSYPVLSWE